MPALSRTCPTQPLTSLRPYECRSKRRTCDSESDADSDSSSFAFFAFSAFSAFSAFFAFFAFDCIDQNRVPIFLTVRSHKTIRALTA